MRFLLLLLITFGPLSVYADKYTDYQLRRLFDPTISEYAAENKGKIHIYDGLTSLQVDDALNNNFNRIDNMMFTRIVHVDERGVEYVEEDGCD